MKRINLFISLLILATIGLFTACEDITDPQPPNISLDGSTGYIADDAEVPVGSTFKIKITATPNAESQAKLTNISITRTFNNIPTTVLDSALSKETSVVVEVTFQAQLSEGEERIVIEVEDKDGEVAEEVINITTVTGLIEYSSKILGSYSSATGSSFVSYDGSVVTLDQAVADPTKVDIVFFHGSIGGDNEATLSAPNDDVLDAVFGTGTNDPANWGTQNATKLEIVTTDFDAVSTIDDIPDVGTSGTSKVVKLEVGDVVAFKTAPTSAHPNKKGLAEVEAITEDAGDPSVGKYTITLNFKVESN